MMVFMALLPAGIYQAYHSITTGLWYARSAEVIHGGVMEAFVWLRVPGDLVFALGAVLLAVYALMLLVQPKIVKPEAAGRPAIPSDTIATSAGD